MVAPNYIPPTPPMPGVREKLIYINDLRDAVERISRAWNPTQLSDAVASAQYFLDKFK